MVCVCVCVRDKTKVDIFSYSISNCETFNNEVIPEASSHQKSISVDDEKRQAPKALQANRENQTPITIEIYVFVRFILSKNLIRSKSWILPECGGGVEVGGGEHDGEGDESGDELGEAEDEAACCSWHALNILHSHWRSIVGSASRAHGDRNYRTNRRSAHVHHVKGESLLITETQMRN